MLRELYATAIRFEIVAFFCFVLFFSPAGGGSSTSPHTIEILFYFDRDHAQSGGELTVLLGASSLFFPPLLFMSGRSLPTRAYSSFRRFHFEQALQPHLRQAVGYIR